MRTFLEYILVKRRGKITRETTDYVDQEEIIENRIVPDAGFILENIETHNRALFFTEMDMATERIASLISRDSRITIRHKIKQYDRYLQNLRYQETYAPYGNFGYFTLLFVTLNQTHVENIRRELADLPPELSPYYHFTTYEEAMGECALQAHNVQPPEMAALTTRSQQSGTESCAGSGNVPGEA